MTSGAARRYTVNMVRPLLATFALLAVLVTSLAARAEPPPEAAATFLQDLTRSAISELGNVELAETERRRTFRRLLREKFDMRRISRFVLGRYWRPASEAQRDAFEDAFVRLIAKRFLPMFEAARDSGTRVKPLAARALPEREGIYRVTTDVTLPAYNIDMRVDWHIRREASGFRIEDVRSEGVSMAIMLRAEYNSVLQRNGGDVQALIARMRRVASRAD